MNFKILASLCTIMLASTAMGYGTFAYFSDTETSSDNLFVAGDLDLTLDGQQGVSGTITGGNFAPGDATSGSILLRNEGSIFTGDAQNHTVLLDLKLVTNVTDDTGNPQDADDGGVSAVPFDQFLVLTTLAYGGQDLLAQVGDADGDGRANTLADLVAAGPLTGLADPGADGKTLDVAVTFSTAGGNDLKRDQVDATFVFHLRQAAAPPME